MTKIPAGESGANNDPVATYVEQNYPSYEAQLEQALKANAESGSTFAHIANPVITGQTQTEKVGRDQILDKLKEQFCPQYPDRVMSRVYSVVHEDKPASELDPPASAFEVIRFFAPQSGGHAATKATGVRVGLVH